MRRCGASWGRNLRSAMDEWLIEPFDRAHERDAFASGKEPLDQFLRSFVGQYERRNLGRTYVAVRPGQKKVFGYYTLSSGAISIHVLPGRAAKKLPRHAVPAALLGRLAVDRAERGRGLGA